MINKDLERKSITKTTLRIGDYVARHSTTWVGSTVGIVVGFSKYNVAVVTDIMLTYGSTTYIPAIRVGNKYLDKDGKIKRPETFPNASYPASEFAIVTGQEDSVMKDAADKIKELVEQYKIYEDGNNRSNN